MIQALDQIQEFFPFKLLGFHSNNGSEYINKRIASILVKLEIEFTKTRSRKSNDNDLAERNNGHIVRKMFGHALIPECYASQMNEFNTHYLNPHINYYQPCLSP